MGFLSHNKCSGYFSVGCLAKICMLNQSTRHWIDIHDEKLLKDLKAHHLAEPKKKKIHV